MELKMNIKEKQFDFLVFENVKINLNSGNCYGLVGLNGTGKTTLFQMILNLDKKYNGTIEFSENIDKNYFYISADFEIPLFLSGIEYIEYIHKAYNLLIDNDKLESFLLLFEMGDYRNMLIEEYSFGMKKKIQIIALLLLDIDVWLLDEITSGLDIKTTIILSEIIIKLKTKKLMIISSHELEFIDMIADYSLVIKDQTIVKTSEKIVNFIYEDNEIIEKKRLINNDLFND